MLAVRDLAVSRGGLPLVRGVTFDLGPGAALVLRGPNGIGKTTLLRTIAGLQPPDAGQIDAASEAVAYAGHKDGVKPTLTVAETLDFWAEVHGRTVPETVWEDFNLGALRGRMGGTLSAGQTRRLGLARLAVIGRPVLLLDEPTVSLDRASVRLFAGWLTARHLAAGGVAVVATHIDLGLAAPELDLSHHRVPARTGDADEAFL